MNVPKLRFKEFNEDYQLIELGKLVNYQKGFAFKSSDYQNFGTRIVRITDTTSNSIKENDAVFIDTDKAKNYYNYLLKENDIIISSVGSKPPLYDSMVGKVVLVPSHADKSLLNQNAIRFRAIKHNQRYLYNCLKQNTYTKFIESIMRGNANQRSIALDDLFKYVISLPNDINEENKIANLFSSLDKKIELQAKKIEALKLYKKGLDKFIFNNEYLFFKEKFKLYFDSDGGTALEEFISENGTHRIISIGNYSQDGTYIDNNQKVLFNDKTATKLLCKDNLVMILNDKTTTGDIIGSTLLIDKDDTYIYNQRSQKLICKGINPQYAWCFLNNCLFRKQVFRLSQGGTQIYINFSVLENQNILIPKDDKIEKMIIESIIGVKDKIVLETRKLMNLEKLKKGLIQKMFV